MVTVSVMGVDPEEQVAVLQARIHERLDALRAIGAPARGGPERLEHLDLDTGADAPSAHRAVREIDLTDGIDLTDERLAEDGWDEPDDPDSPGPDDIDPDDVDDPGDREVRGSGPAPRHGGGSEVTEGRLAGYPDPSSGGTGGRVGEPRTRSRRHHAGGTTGGNDGGRHGARLLGDDAFGGDTFGDGQDDEPGLAAAHDAPASGALRPSTVQEATDAVIAATRELISYERRLPVLLDAQPRRLSLRIVRWSGVMAGLVAAVLLVAALAGGLARWWLLPGMICAGAGYLLLRLPVHPPGDRHESLRPGAVVVAFGALVTALCAAAGMPVTVLLLGVVSIGAGLWHAQQTPLRISTLSGPGRGVR